MLLKGGKISLRPETHLVLLSFRISDMATQNESNCLPRSGVWIKNKSTCVLAGSAPSAKGKLRVLGGPRSPSQVGCNISAVVKTYKGRMK